MEVRSVKLVVETLNHAGGRYLIAGGLAVNAHGYMRASQPEVHPGGSAPFVSLKTLRAIKQAAGRDIDLIDINCLQKLHPDA